MSGPSPLAVAGGTDHLRSQPIYIFFQNHLIQIRWFWKKTCRAPAHWPWPAALTTSGRSQYIFFFKTTLSR